MQTLNSRSVKGAVPYGAYAAALLAATIGIASLSRTAPAAVPTDQPISTPPPLASAPKMQVDTELPCVDHSPDCAAWERLGECVSNPNFMHAQCARACGSCGVPEHSVARAAAALEAARSSKCADKTSDCPLWARAGECDANPGFMKLNCPIACDSCDWADFEKRCRVDPNATWAVPPGAIGELFRAIDAGAFAHYQPRIVSRPPEPWAAIFDSFLEPAVADEIVAIATRKEGSRFVPSQGTGGIDTSGQLVATLSDYRTSSTHWCEDECLNETSVVELRRRVVQLTGVPDANHEYPQLLRYREGQYYKEHSECARRCAGSLHIPPHSSLPGPPLLSPSPPSPLSLSPPSRNQLHPGAQGHAVRPAGLHALRLPDGRGGGRAHELPWARAIGQAQEGARRAVAERA
jgi:hypothetical protein